MPDLFGGMFTARWIFQNVAWSLLVTFVLWIFEKVRGKQLEAQRKILFWIVSFVGIFLVVSILTYAGKGIAAPDLKGSFDQVTFTTLEPGHATGILVLFEVRNNGAPSIVDNFALTVSTPERGPTTAQPVFIPKALALPPSPGTSALPIPLVCGKDALYRKTGEQPLITGGLARGYLFYQLPGYNPENVSNPTGTQFSMTFTDVTGKRYESKWVWPAVTIPIGYLPGASLPKSEKPEEACD